MVRLYDNEEEEELIHIVIGKSKGIPNIEIKFDLYSASKVTGLLITQINVSLINPHSNSNDN